FRSRSTREREGRAPRAGMPSALSFTRVTGSPGTRTQGFPCPRNRKGSVFRRSPFALLATLDYGLVRVSAKLAVTIASPFAVIPIPRPRTAIVPAFAGVSDAPRAVAGSIGALAGGSHVKV